ncbi:MAG: polysaccharide deacetylase family protein [Bacteroidetes bacterium]|nr:MAG: polysaccharide deacetylase family protein [Bacteroidota bacterium]
MLLFGHNHEIYKKIFPSVFWNFSETKTKKIFLTFDDGPNSEVTTRVLDILDKYNAKATFFCLGENVEKHPELYEKIIKKNHSVGNHTYSHINGWFTKNKKYFNDIDQANFLIKSNLFRPPFGKTTPSQIIVLKKQYKIVLWDVMSMDYNNHISKEKSLKNIFKYTKNGSIIVFHDTLKAQEKLFYLLPLVLEKYSKSGFEFVSIK